MGFAVEQPPKADEQLAEKGKEIFEAAKRLGLDLDVQGFLMSWVGGTRVIVERDTSGTIVSLAFLAVGKRWLHDDFTATVLDLRGNREPMLCFIRTIANALGATALFTEEPEPLEQGENFIRYVVRRDDLQ